MTHPAFPAAFRDALNALCIGWRVRGDEVRGPAGTSVHFAQTHESSSPGHVDVEFRCRGRRRLLPPFRRAPGMSLWDCIAGIGETMEERAQFAARAWAQSTGAACLEVSLSGRGDFATHVGSSDSFGFTGWHAIHSPILSYGKGASPATLQAWCEEHPILPTIAEATKDHLKTQDGPCGIKLLLGAQDIAEVRIDGEHDEAGSAALLALPWPRLDPPAFVRIYAILIHPH